MSIRPNLLEMRAAGTARVARARIAASLFRTDALPRNERFAAWHDSVGVMLDTHLAPHADPERFHGAIESYLLDDIIVSRPQATAQKFDRPGSRIARDGLDHYMIQLFLRGGTQIARGRRTLAAERCIVGFDLAEALDSYNSNFDMICVVMPRARLAPLLRQPDSLQAAMPSDRGGGGLLAEFLPRVFASLPDLAPHKAAPAARALTELIAIAFNGEHIAAGDASEIALRAVSLKALGFIKSRLANPMLGPDDVAAALGLSRSALYRLFKERGGVAGYIREQRLRRCFADLVSARGRDKQVAEIAWRHGFSDAAHFSRLFRARFGCAPSEARADADAGQRRDRGARDSRVGDRRYEDWIAALA